MIPRPLNLWTLGLSPAPSPATLQRWAGCLSPAERERAGRYRTQGRMAQAIGARTLLRHALSWQAGGGPASWRLGEDAQGRPELTSPEHDFDFNVSHTDDLVVCAVAEGVSVGVDVEHANRALQMRAVESRFLSVAERRRWQAQQPADADRYIVQLWTLKEAWAKALGVGLGIDFTTVEFEIDPPGDIRLLSAPEWRFQTCHPPSGHVISLAWRSADQVRVRAYDGAAMLGAAPGPISGR